MSSSVMKVVIVGGGSAGWMTAVALASLLSKKQVEVVVVESPDVASVGVGEATIPEIKLFNDLVGIDEIDFVINCQATYKLGIEFTNWGQKGHSYMHAFGSLGTPLDNLPFYQYWQRLYLEEQNLDLNDFSVCAQAARQNRFMPPTLGKNTPLSQLRYAYHFDAVLYSDFLKRISLERGVSLIKQHVVGVDCDIQSGDISHLRLKDGQCVSGDLFIDCTGMNALLIGKALSVKYIDWRSLLPCDSAVTVASSVLSDLPPYTRSTAHCSGWQWQIPLRHRTGNGHVYCSQFIDDVYAQQILLSHVEGECISSPKLIKFTTGRREKFWYKNCVAIGLSSGFLEPLESTSIHMIQESIFRLLDLFPAKDETGLYQHRIEREKYNQLLANKFESIRDFIIMHYFANSRKDSPFWSYCQQLPIPESLKEKIMLYQSSSRIYRDSHDLFSEEGWISVMHGQGIKAKNCHPIAKNRSISVVKKQLLSIKSVIDKTVSYMPKHKDFLQRRIE